jgi:putative cofactor-binding repeat protein
MHVRCAVAIGAPRTVLAPLYTFATATLLQCNEGTSTMCNGRMSLDFSASERNDWTVNLFSFQRWRRKPILRSPKGGGGFREGWGGLPTGGVPMTYTFKLSRRLARLRDVSLVIAVVFTASCNSDESTGPDSGPVSDPNGISVAPGSVLIGANQAVQFLASTLDSSGLSANSKKGRGRGRRSVASLSVSPETLTVAGGSPANFVATATLSDGSSAEPSVLWSASGGSIDAQGRYTAGPIPGAYAVSATTLSGVADTAAVIVTQSLPTIVDVSLSPTIASLAVGGTKHFLAVGKANDGSTVAVGARYAATGGTISTDGIYQAGQTPGNFRVIATDTVTNLADTAAVIIEAPPATLQAVVLSPSTVSLTVGGTQRFTVTGKMSDGSTTSVVVSWSATGGQISSDGLYTAGNTAGTYRVIAMQQGGTLADTSAVSITAPQTAPSPPQAGELPTPLRTVNVSPGGLQAALNNALPGDRIVLAPGTYNGGYLAARSGTAQNPIVVTGPRTAILSGSLDKGLTITGSYWIFNGFRITNVVNGGIAGSGGNYNIYEYLEIDHIQQAGIYIRAGSSTATVTGNTIRYCNIHDTGVGPHPEWGEGIYLGNGITNDDRALNTHVHHNTIGPNIGSDGIEAKRMADGNTIEFNTIMKDITIRSNNNMVRDNTLTLGGPSSAMINNNEPSGGANNNTYRRNQGSNGTRLFLISDGTGVRVCSDNVVVQPTVMGYPTVACP